MILQFTRHYKLFNAGEVAALDDAEAARLLRSGVAVPVGVPEAEPALAPAKRGRKTVAEPEPEAPEPAPVEPEAGEDS